MKNLFLMTFICSMINVYGQTSYNCYHLQEFSWNSKTQKYDLPAEKSDLSVFTVDKEKKNITQTFDDGVAHLFVIRSETTDAASNSLMYTVVSPSNGYTYQYKIDASASVIEIHLVENNNTTLLKKYLYKK